MFEKFTSFNTLILMAHKSGVLKS